MSDLIARGLSLAIDSLSFGLILFLISSGLTITLGVMRVANLAHCGFAMIGGYIAVSLMRAYQLSLFVAAPIAVLATMAIGLALEITIFRWVYRQHQFGQILMTIGLAFIMVAGAHVIYGPFVQTVPVPPALAGSANFIGLSLPAYRVFLMALSLLIGGGLWYLLDFTLFGARLRAAIDDPKMALSVGINVSRLMALAFVGGCGLAAVGGIFGTQMLPLEPFYAIKYLVTVLMVVAVGGLGSLKGSFVAALLLAVLDGFGRYYLPSTGAFALYVAVIGILLVRRDGLFARG